MAPANSASPPNECPRYPLLPDVVVTSTTLDNTPVPLLPAPPALIDHESVLPFVFSARKFQVLLLRLVLVLIVYTSFILRAVHPTMYTRNEPFHARSMIRAPARLLFDRNQHVNAAVPAFVAMLEAEKAANPDITQEELDRRGLKFFTILSMRKRDTKSFVSLLRSQKDREALRLEREKFEFDAAKAALAKLPELLALTRDTSLSDDDRLEQARLKLFGSTPA